MSNSDSDITEENLDFGAMLAAARKTKNYTVAEVSRHLKIPVDIFTAIENNNLDALPAPAFTKGYIRAYAKFLGLSEESVVERYNRAVPDESVFNLKPRSRLAGEVNSQSFLMKSMTMLFIVGGLAAVVYGSFSYYQEKADSMESERETKEDSFTGHSLDSAGENRSNIEQNDDLATNDQTVIESLDPLEITAAMNKTEAELADIELDISETADSATTATPETNDTLSGVVEEPAEVSESEVNSANDVLEVFAQNGAWVEVYDANNTRLFYNMVPEGVTKKLIGQAPFRLSIGNAKTTRVVINEIKVDMSKYIRRSNTASFSISTDEQNVIFH